jgi:putative chitinase
MQELFPKYGLTTEKRIAAFLAQVGHESNNLTVLTENLNYSATRLRQVFGKYFGPGKEDPNAYARQPEKIANLVYGNRMGNGPVSTGDGFRFRGRGIIQLTGKDNYSRFAKSIGKSLEETIGYLETIPGALESALWFWSERNLNSFADTDNIREMTRLINGGFNGLEDRLARYQQNLRIITSISNSPAIVQPTPVRPTTTRPILRRGSQGEDVRFLQEKLQLTADGVFGLATYLAVKQFQRSRGLPADGIVGPKTWSSILG